MTIHPKAELIMVKITDGKAHIMIGTEMGKAIKFHESQIRPMGRQAAGVRGIRLNPKDKIIGMIVIGEKEEFAFTVSENGYGKKTDVKLYPTHRRGGLGVANLKVNKKLGKAIGMTGISNEEILFITQNGKVIRIQSTAVRPIGRATQGVKIINIGEKDKVCSLAKVTEE
jgi:DNA gyrase subunit A